MAVHACLKDKKTHYAKVPFHMWQLIIVVERKNLFWSVDIKVREVSWLIPCCNVPVFKMVLDAPRQHSDLKDKS